MGLPRLHVERASKPSFELNDADVWAALREITPLYRAEDGTPALQQTRVQLCFDERALYVRFDCNDREIWGTYTQRDDPIYEQEVVELFLAPELADPIHYFEFEVSPNSVLFDTTVYNPISTREELRWDASWNCAGIHWIAERDDSRSRWWAALAIPWSEIALDGRVPAHCRANFCRIERPRDTNPEFSCWSPTMTNPADFHKPAYFGVLDFDRGSMR
jgi:Carbohydrate-binding family 9